MTTITTITTTTAHEPHLIVRHATLDSARAAEARLSARYPRNRFAVTSDPIVPIFPFAVVADGETSPTGATR